MPIMPGCQSSPARTRAGRYETPAGESEFRLQPDIGLLGLALFIEPVQVAGQFPGLAAIFGQEQLQGSPGLAQAAGGVQPGRQLKRYISQGYGAIRQAGHFFEGLEARAPAFRQNLQAMAYQNAVHAGKGHDICDRAQGHQIEVIFDIGFRAAAEPALLPEAGPEAQHQIQGHPHAGQLFEGIAAIRAFRVDHGQGGRQFGGGS